MKFPTPVSLQWMASLIDATLYGDPTAVATGINEIHKVEAGDLVFVDHPKYYTTCIQSAACCIIIDQHTAYPEGKALLVVAQPFEAYQKIVRHFRPFSLATNMIDVTASIGEGTYIGPNSFIGKHVQVGKNCRIHPNVTIMDYCLIGDNVIIQSGTVIGSDAFYYNGKKDREVWYKKMESCGRVIIEHDVEVGANCTIDRGVTHDTRLGSGTKLDNIVHVGHDVVVGKNCLLASQVGIAGATTLGDGVTLWGQVGVNKTITIGAHATVMGQSGVVSSLQGGKVYWGTPAEGVIAKKRELVWIKRIPEIWQKLQLKNENKG